MGPRRARIASGVVAGGIGLLTLPAALAGFAMLASYAGILTPTVLVLCLGASLVVSIQILLAVYDCLCLRWSDEIEPHRFPPGSVRRIRDFIGI